VIRGIDQASPAVVSGLFAHNPRQAVRQ